MAVLRYYLSYNNDEDLARGLLILFKPFRNEKEEIHQNDVKELLKNNNDLIQEKRKMFEKYKVMTDLISSIQSEVEDTGNKSDEDDEDEFEEMESTNLKDIDEFNKWARSQASQDLSGLKSLTNVCKPQELRTNISSLNEQQRRLFDDFTEQMVSTDIN